MCYQGKMYGLVKYIINYTVDTLYFEQKVNGLSLTCSSILNTVLAHYNLLRLGCALRKIEGSRLL